MKNKMKQNLEKLIRKLIPFYWVILILTIGLAFLVHKPAIKLLTTISTELSTLLPDHHPTVKTANEIKEKFSRRSGGNLFLIIQSDNPEKNIEYVEKIREHLLTNPEIGKLLITKEGHEYYKKHMLLLLDKEDLQEIKERVQKKIRETKLGSLYIDFTDDEAAANPGEGKKAYNDIFSKYREEYAQGVSTPYFTSPDKKIFQVKIYPKSENTSLGFYKKFFKQMDGMIKEFNAAHPEFKDIQYNYAGAIKTRIDEYNSLMSDLARAGIISIVGIFILLTIYYRSVMCVLAVFIPMALGILFGFSICAHFVKQLNLVTSFLFSILFGLGVDIGIHMLSRYREDRLSHIGVDQSIVNILLQTGRTSAVAVMTTCTSFFILLLNDFRGFSEFGLIAGTGLLVTLFVYLVFFPALLVFFEKIHILKFKMTHPLDIHKGLARFPKAKAVVVVSIILTALSLVALPFEKFEWDFSVLKMKIPETEQARALLKKVDSRVNSPAAVIVKNREHAEHIKKIVKWRAEYDKDFPTLDKFRSMYDLEPTDQTEKMKELKEIDRLLADDALNVLKGDDKIMLTEFREAIANTELIDPTKIPEGIKQAFLPKEGINTTESLGFIYPQSHIELGDGRNAIRFYDDAHEIYDSTATEGGKFYSSSDALIFADVLKTLFRDSTKAISFSFLVLAIIIYFDFLNWRKALLVLGVLVSGILWMIGVMVPLGLKFNFYNMITIPMMIGMGEDNSVHMVHRYEELGSKNVMSAVRSAGGAACMASLTSMLGYAGLLFVHHPGLKSIGVLAVVGLTTCMLTSLVVLPACLQWLQDRKSKNTQMLPQ